MIIDLPNLSDADLDALSERVANELQRRRAGDRAVVAYLHRVLDRHGINPHAPDALEQLNDILKRKR